MVTFLDGGALSITGTETMTKPGGYQFGVTGGNGPYTWSVTGNGATIDQTGYLSLDNTACGTAVVTCTDCTGRSVSHIGTRVTNNGKWQYTIKPGAQHGDFTIANAYGGIPGTLTVYPDYSSANPAYLALLASGCYNAGYWVSPWDVGWDKNYWDWVGFPLDCDNQMIWYFMTDRIGDQTITEWVCN